MIYVAPSASRPRPYSQITDSKKELDAIMDAERRIQHLSLWNTDFRTADWKLAELRGTGSIYGLYCYKSVLVNGMFPVSGRSGIMLIWR